MREIEDPADVVRGRVRHLLGTELSSQWDADQQLGWAGMMEVSRQLSSKHDREMVRKHGFSLTLLSLLGRLDACDGPALQARDLASDLQISPGRVSRHLATLEAAGLAVRSSNAQDGRGLDVELTKSGREQLAEARQTARDIVERDFLSLLTPDELATLSRVAAKILRGTAEAAAQGHDALTKEPD